jgi:hypothetical protein
VGDEPLDGVTGEHGVREADAGASLGGDHQHALERVALERLDREPLEQLGGEQRVQRSVQRPREPVRRGLPDPRFVGGAPALGRADQGPSGAADRRGQRCVPARDGDAQGAADDIAGRAGEGAGEAEADAACRCGVHAASIRRARRPEITRIA